MLDEIGNGAVEGGNSDEDFHHDQSTSTNATVSLKKLLFSC
jgi:hypothetical protein